MRGPKFLPKPVRKTGGAQPTLLSDQMAPAGSREPHPDDLAVDRFAAAMKAKLAKKRAEGYGGWDNPEECTIEHLTLLLVSHLSKGDPIDIGNFAMMIHQRGAAITAGASGGFLYKQQRNESGLRYGLCRPEDGV